MKKLLLALLSAFLFVADGIAQNTSAKPQKPLQAPLPYAPAPASSRSSAPDSASGFRLRLKPLEDVIRSAVENNPLIKVNSTDIMFEEVQKRLEKRGWAEWFSVGAGSFYGNGSALNISSDGGIVTYLPTQRRSTSFNLNLNLNIPGGDLINRKQRLELNRLDIQRKQQDRLEIERQIRLQVTEIYCRAETAIRILKIKSEGVESLRLAMQVSENFFRQGTLNANEYSEILDRLNHAEDELEIQKGEAKRFCLILQELAGGIPVTY